MEFFYKIFTIITLTYLILMKLRGKEQEFVKKKFKIYRFYETKNKKNCLLQIFRIDKERSVEIFDDGGGISII